MNMLADVVNSLVSVCAVFVFLVLALSFMWHRPYRRAPRMWLTLGVIVYGLLAVPIVPYAASRLIGRGYMTFAPRETEKNMRAVVLLGAGTQIVESPDQELALLDGAGAARVLEAARVYRQLDRPWVISSGGTRRTKVELSSAVAMQRALIQLGVAPERILVEGRSLTTRDEAVLIAPMLRELQADRFVLVTHRAHMLRSMAAFRQQSLTPIPAIVPDGLGNARWKDLLTPGVEGLQLSQALLHEVFGLGYYRWQGWTTG